jgi:DNA-binding transcriptional MerR regulator
MCSPPSPSAPSPSPRDCRHDPGLLTLAELSARSGVPAPRLRHYAEAGLLPPARRNGHQLGYSPAEVSTARLLVGADDLGLPTGTLTTLAAAWRDGDCTSTRQYLIDAVTARLDQVQADIAERNRQAVAAGPGTSGWAKQIAGSASRSEDAARLQAVAAALTTGEHDGERPRRCQYRHRRCTRERRSRSRSANSDTA